MLVLHIGNRNYSSWSLRAWLLLAKSGLAFDTRRVVLFEPGSAAAIAAVTPAGKVPVLHDDGLVVWDSLAIGEYVAERAPALWPAAAPTRARARSIAAEMHAGFAALRSALPMNCRASGRQVACDDDVLHDIERVRQIVDDCRRDHGADGPWLFGEFSIADAMYAPVMSRFTTYGVVCDGAVEAYRRAVLNDTDMQAWYALARDEYETIAAAEVG